MFKRITILTLLTVLIACQTVMADNNLTGQSEHYYFGEDQITPINLTNPSDQLNGEWNIIEADGQTVYLPRETWAYLFFDYDNHVMYGNTGSNSINAVFTVDGSNNFKLQEHDFYITNKTDNLYQDAENRILKGLRESRTIALYKKGDIEFMELKRDKNHVSLKLVRHNLDFMNGSWLVESINGKDVSMCQIKLVNDIDLQTVNIVSGSNIINGAIYIDHTEPFGIEYEDLKSTRYQWKYIDTETRLLISLEETLYCRKLNESEVELYTKELDERGYEIDKSLVVLRKP